MIWLVKEHNIIHHYNKKQCEIRSKYILFPIAPKCKDVHFKIINVNYCLTSDAGNSNVACLFCKAKIETVEHLFFMVINNLLERCIQLVIAYRGDYLIWFLAVKISKPEICFLLDLYS